MRSLWTVIGFAILGCASLVRAQDLGFQVQVGTDAPSTVWLNQGTGGTWDYSSGTLTLDNSVITTANIAGTQQSGLIIDPDPSINFGFGVSNTGTTTQQYTFTFPMPAAALAVNLPPGLYNVSATFGDTLTASPGDTAVFSLPSGTTSYEQSFINSQDAGVDINSSANNPEVVVGGTDGNTQTFSFTKSLGQELLSSTGTTMSVTTTFDLTPGDSASFSGSFTVMTVSATPEPSSVALGLVAVLGFAVLAIRARARQA
jgi:hypothetical protein